ncbi:MAG: hypothetical protein NT069_06950, partial [Planctomycetota bacterium]|nr:hypothetical protein [Planctomycetota bacterium]
PFLSRRRSCGVTPDGAAGGWVGKRHPSFGFSIARASVADTAFQSVSTELCRRCPDRGVVGTPSATWRDDKRLMRKHRPVEQLFLLLSTNSGGSFLVVFGKINDCAIVLGGES